MKKKEEEKYTIKDGLKEFVQTIGNVISIGAAVFFVISTIYFFRINFRSSPFYKFIIISVLLYLLTYIIFLIATHSNKKKQKDAKWKFTSWIILLTTLFNLFFVSSSILIILQSALSDSKISFGLIVEIAVSSIFLTVKFFYYIIRLIIWLIQKKMHDKEKNNLFCY